MRRLLVTLGLTLFAALGTITPAHAEEKCVIAVKGDSPVAKACQSGGQPAAAKQMKTLVKAARAKGVDYKCDSCHVDMTGYKLTDNARDDFAKLLSAAK